MPDHEPTYGQSLRNFTDRSMLNSKDIVRVLDNWLDDIRNDRLAVPLCAEGKAALRHAVETVRAFALSNAMPTILPSVTGTCYRYSLDFYRNSLQLGIERYTDTVRFDSMGDPTVESMAQDTEKDDRNDMPWYIMVYRAIIPFWPIDKWAERNGVKTATARQWVSRGRIHASKEGGALRVSAIQYTPSAFRQAKSVSHRFRMIEKLPDGIVRSYPALSGQVLDLLVTQDRNDPGLYRVISIHTGETGTPRADTMSVTLAQREELLSAIYELEGVDAPSDKYYVQPFVPEPEGAVIHHADLTAIGKDENKFLRTLEVSGSTRSEAPHADGGSRSEPIVRLDVTVTDPGTGKSVRLAGRYCLYAMTAESRLLYCIFGYPDIVSEIDQAISDTGIAARRKYESTCNRHILLVDKLDIDGGFPDAHAVLKALPKLCRRSVCIEPDLVLLNRSAATEAAVAHRIDAASAGYRDAGTYLYAYTPTGRVFTGFREEKTKEVPTETEKTDS